MKKIEFTTLDNVELTGFLEKCYTKTEYVILSIHGMGANCFKKREEKIAKNAIKNNIDFFSFNNRGSELVKYINKNGKKQICGSSYEDVLDGYYDIVGAVEKLKELGYKNIYLQGHSLGSTKIVYTYNKLLEEKNILLESIKGILLLSLVDLPKSIKIYLNKEYEKIVKFAEEKEKNGLSLDIMPPKTFIHPISVKTFLRYARDYEKIDFAKYGEDKEFKILNKINIPLFMRWGNTNEFILQEASELVEILNNQIKNDKKDIGYIQNANHSYTDKEEIIGIQIIEFIKKYKG